MPGWQVQFAGRGKRCTPDAALLLSRRDATEESGIDPAHLGRPPCDVRRETRPGALDPIALGTDAQALDLLARAIRRGIRNPDGGVRPFRRSEAAIHLHLHTPGVG